MSLRAATTQDSAGDTYRYLRIIMPLPAAWLLISIVGVWLVRQRLLGSISDYYGGPLRDVFVGGLIASGIGMIAYKGQSRLEDYALNFAGFNAFFVALISNSFQGLLDNTRAAQKEGVPVPATRADLVQNLHISLWSLLIVAVVLIILDWKVFRWTRFRWKDQTRWANILIGLVFAAELVLVVIVVAMLLGWETAGTTSVYGIIHTMAAITLIVSLSFAAASHAWATGLRQRSEASSDRPAVKLAFKVISILMWLGICVGLIAILIGVSHAVFWTEVVELGLFLAFWVTATWAEETNRAS